MPSFRSDGLDLAYIDTAPDAGREYEPVLLIHGFASTLAVNWQNTLWVQTLARAGRRVIALDNRGHGDSDKPHEIAAYDPSLMAQDAANLLDHLGLDQADVMGYSMGARITAFLAVAHPQRVRRAVFGGLGIHLVEGEGLPQSVREALEAESLDVVTDPMGRMFRRFAETNKADLAALSACIRGTRRNMTPVEAASITCPVLIGVGTSDPIAGDPYRLAALIPRAQVLEIPGRDHNSAVGDKVFKAAVLHFLERGD